MAARGKARTLLGALLLACPCAFALNPALDVSQYAHTKWTAREGFSRGAIHSIAQTPDGYLWLGTEFGLLRFDGVSRVAWQPPSNQILPSNNITKLLAARDGTLWIGTTKGLASWKAGRLTQFAELAGLITGSLFEDHEGTVWVGGWAVSGGRVCSIQKGSVQCSEGDGRFGFGVLDWHEDSKGNLWAGVRTGVWRWKPDPPKFIRLPGEAGNTSLAEDDEGELLIGRGDGIRRLVEGNTEAYRLPGTSAKFDLRRFLRDRDGSMWGGTLDRGLLHVHQGRTDIFAQSDGLSGDVVRAVFEDREGNIWVSTTDGLDRFRELPVVNYSTNQGLPNVSGGVITTGDGSVWLAGQGSLTRWNHGKVTIYRERSERGKAGVREIAGSGVPNRFLESLFQDSRGRIWVATPGGIGYLKNDQFISIPAVPGGYIASMAEDTRGNFWIANQDHGLFRLSAQNDVEQIPWASFGRKDYALELAADPLQGGLWLGFYSGGAAWFRDDRVRASYTAADGLGEGRVNQLRFDGEGALWAATEGGLSRLKSGRIATLTSKNGLPCDAVHWTIEDDAESVWLYMPCGLVRVARSELEAWAAAMDRAGPLPDGRGSESGRGSGYILHPTVFDSPDGVRSVADVGTFTPDVAKSRDGKLWFIAEDGISMVDPRQQASAAGAHRAGQSGWQSLPGKALAPAGPRRLDRLHGPQPGCTGTDSVSIQAGGPGQRLERGSQRSRGAVLQPSSPQLPLSRDGCQ
jgi:ligand-binding sensor domain-containing protein